MLRLAAQGPDHDAACLQFGDDVGRGRAECADDHPDARVAQRNLHQAPRAIGRHVAAPRSDFVVDALALVVGQPGHALGGEDVVEKIAMGLRNQARRVV